MAFQILLRTSSLVTWSLYEMPRRRLKLLISTVCIFLSISAVNVQVSQEYKNKDTTKECNSPIFELRPMFLSYQMILSFVSDAIIWAILERTSGMDPSSVTMAPKYLKLWTVSSFLPLTLMLLLMPFVLLVINLVFSALICMPYAVEVLSRRSTRLANSNSEPARPSMSSAKRKFEIILPPMLNVDLWSSSASAIILSRNMLKRVGESRQPCLTPIVVLNQSPVLLLKQTALVALSQRFCITLIRFVLILYNLIVAQSAGCHTLSNAFLESLKTW